MASTDTADPVQHSLKEERPETNHADLTSLKDTGPDTHGVLEVEKGAGERSGEPSPAPSSPASGVSTTKSAIQAPSASGQTSTPPLSMPHPKKFSHVNINKKFLEKTSASTPTHTLSALPVTKVPSTNQKPALQTSVSHPRLVTAKLTAASQPSTTTGPGWSRPSSAVPSAAPTPHPANSVKGSPAPSATLGGVPLPPPVGKVIQPQARSSQDAGSPVNIVKLDMAQSDFPTAAEAAQGRAVKAAEKIVAQEAAAVHKQTIISELQAEEDTFRGVHLDPNAHHWDEMEEDDDNFLGGVIEFGDGRQYQVQSAQSSQQTQLPQDAKEVVPGMADKPVSKEDRFAEDFDRSWPRSRPPQHAPGPHREQRPDGFSTSPSGSSHSPQEASRVLFNERSNRLEPYSHQRYGTPGATFPRRGSRSDHAISPTEPRRDAPPHTHLSGIQVLQRGNHAESASFSRAPGDRPPISPHDGSRFRDRQPPQRDNPLPSGGYHGPDRFGTHGLAHPPRDAGFDDRTRRTSGAEPSSVSPIGDHRRQLPPHLSAMDPRQPPAARTEPPVQSQPAPHVSSILHEPPALSASSQAAISPATPDKALPASTMPIVDMEEVRKAAMHSAAERAKLRRQQEEEEREKERERARRKAAELEERIKAQEQEKAREREKAESEKKHSEAEVVGFIEEAVSSAGTAENKVAVAEASVQRHPDARHTLGRNTSARGTSRPFNARRASSSFTPTAAPVNLPVQSSPAQEADTWRRKNPPSAQPPVVMQKSPATPILPPPVLAHAGLDVQVGEEVEVMDFSDHGRLAGSDGPAKPSQHEVALTGRPSRAVASDFFEDLSPSAERVTPQNPRSEEESWRRGPPPKPNVNVAQEAASPVGPHDGHHVPAYPHSTTVNGFHASGSFSAFSSHQQNGAHRPPPSTTYREAPMAALNDVMARIKGAIDVIHHEHDVKAEIEAPKPQKWLPPALRAKSTQLDLAAPLEVFDVTSSEPPKSPKPAWKIFHAKLPHVHRPLAPSPRTELVWPRGLRYPRLEVYSFNPPIELLARRDATVTDVIFSRPPLVRGQPKYFVSIPRRRLNRRGSGAEASPVVNLPFTPVRTRAPGLPKESTSSAVSSWRKAPASITTTWPPVRDEAKEEAGLDTVSRSPPPEAPSPSTGLISAKSKTEPKLPIGSDVAFYRNARVETVAESKPPVQFIVTSELENEPKGQSREAQPLRPTSVNVTPVALAVGSELERQAPIARVVTNGTVTPPPQPPSALSPWPKSSKAFSTKESPARAPDPEHLKAVWSQTSDKAQIQPVNSLKSIADDLTGVPFTLQEVKSDDGETPPPSGAGPWSRMTSHEVTRAFQQVPSSSSSSSQRPPSIAPSTSTSTNGSTSRHAGFSFSPPPMGQPALRPGYSAYSPMMSHTPSPTVMYSQPSPVPRHMVPNGAVPAYPAVWMPGAPPPPPAGMIRSPYPPHYMSYPSPGAPMQMYAPMSMQNGPPQNGVQGRPPSMAMMSPSMPPAMSPMYGSPVPMQAVPAMPPSQGYPMPGQASRAPMRSPYDQNITNGAPMHSSPMRQPPQNGYAPIPANYARPPW
ncbi:hypothetical protein BC628DRAFT_1385840 [Trametes gibbosa]|nr:hypothetical protein BC628DRAFT_1385840 [Trametes gibbosa]